MVDVCLAKISHPRPNFLRESFALFTEKFFRREHYKAIKIIIAFLSDRIVCLRLDTNVDWSANTATRA